MRVSADQPIITLVYIIGGIAAYFVYKLITETEKYKLFKGLGFIFDIVIGLFIGINFLALTHLFFAGQLKYFMFIGYTLGMLIANILLRRPIEIIINKINKGVKIIMNKVKEFFKKVWNKISKVAQSIFKGGKKDEHNNNRA